MTTSPRTLGDGSPGESTLPPNGQRRRMLLAGLPKPVARAPPGPPPAPGTTGRSCGYNTK
ncbi:hypothetical protein [Streptomyces sp. NPDC004050]